MGRALVKYSTLCVKPSVPRLTSARIARRCRDRRTSAGREDKDGDGRGKPDVGRNKRDADRYTGGPPASAREKVCRQADRGERKGRDLAVRDVEQRERGEHEQDGRAWRRDKPGQRRRADDCRRDQQEGEEHRRRPGRQHRERGKRSERVAGQGRRLDVAVGHRGGEHAPLARAQRLDPIRILPLANRDARAVERLEALMADHAASREGQGAYEQYERYAGEGQLRGGSLHGPKHTAAGRRSGESRGWASKPNGSRPRTGTFGSKPRWFTMAWAPARPGRYNRECGGGTRTLLSRCAPPPIIPRRRRRQPRGNPAACVPAEYLARRSLHAADDQPGRRLRISSSARLRAERTALFRRALAPAPRERLRLPSPAAFGDRRRAGARPRPRTRAPLPSCSRCRFRDRCRGVEPVRNLGSRRDARLCSRHLVRSVAPLDVLRCVPDANAGTQLHHCLHAVHRRCALHAVLPWISRRSAGRDAVDLSAASLPALRTLRNAGRACVCADARDRSGPGAELQECIRAAVAARRRRGGRLDLGAIRSAANRCARQTCLSRARAGHRGRCDGAAQETRRERRDDPGHDRIRGGDFRDRQLRDRRAHLRPSCRFALRAVHSQRLRLAELSRTGACGATRWSPGSVSLF